MKILPNQVTLPLKKMRNKMKVMYFRKTKITPNINLFFKKREKTENNIHKY